MTAVDHTPDRPSWDCRACGEPWPCDPARVRLAEEAGQTPLAVYMALQMHDAIADIPGTLPDELFERFIGWTRRGPPYDNRTDHRY